MTDAEQPPPGRSTTPPTYVGLLTQVMSNTLDEDYEAVAAQRKADGEPQRRPSRIGLVVVVCLFGLMIGVSALQTEQDRPQEVAERSELIDLINLRDQRYDDLRGQLSTLQAEVTGLQGRVLDETLDDQAQNDRLEALGIDAGTLAVTGPGVTVTVDNAPPGSSDPGGTILDKDLRLLVNALWTAGAEAVSLDGHRLTSLTAIRFAGQAITVDYRSLSPPYVIQAVGDPDTLPARLMETRGGQIWLGLESNFGIRFDTETKDRVTVPADPKDQLLYAEPAVSR